MRLSGLLLVLLSGNSAISLAIGQVASQAFQTAWIVVSAKSARHLPTLQRTCMQGRTQHQLLP